MAQGEHRERERHLERIARLRPIDDGFMRCLFRDNLPLAQDVLRIVTGISDLTLTKMETQHDLNGLGGARSAVLDVWGCDSAGTVYDLEIQRGGRARPRRARYHSSLLDVEALDVRDAFEALPEIYVIFVMEYDPFGRGLGSYPVERTNLATGEAFGDGSHVLYVNGAYRGKDALGSLMHDFCESDPNAMANRLLAERAAYYKHDPKGVGEMCEVFEEVLAEGRRQGMEQGLEQGMEQGLEQGRRQGMEQGRMEMRAEMRGDTLVVTAGLVRDGVLGIGDAAARFGFTEDEIRRQLAEPPAA